MLLSSTKRISVVCCCVTVWLFGSIRVYAQLQPLSSQYPFANAPVNASSPPNVCQPDSGFGTLSAFPTGAFEPNPYDQQTYASGAMQFRRWTFLPQGFLYQTYWAGTAEPRLATRSISDAGGHDSLDSQIGGRVGLVRFDDPFTAGSFQFDIMGGANLRQNLDTDDWDMTGTDYRYDLPLTYRQGPHAWKFGFYHVSSHMGDEFLAHNPTVERIDYYRDALYLGYSVDLTPKLRAYGEVEYAVSRDFSEPWHLQFGFDWGPRIPTGVRGAPFLAANAHLREELDFGGNISLQTGWAWKGEGPAAGVLRTGLHYYNGGSPQYSFFQEHEEQIGFGLWYDF